MIGWISLNSPMLARQGQAAHVGAGAPLVAESLRRMTVL
jgi:hypothetical protein